MNQSFKLYSICCEKMLNTVKLQELWTKSTFFQVFSLLIRKKINTIIKSDINLCNFYKFYKSLYNVEKFYANVANASCTIPLLVFPIVTYELPHCFSYWIENVLLRQGWKNLFMLQNFSLAYCTQDSLPEKDMFQLK